MTTLRITTWIAALILAVAPAAAADWTVSRVSGEVKIQHGGAQPVSLAAKGVIGAGARITTGANGRVMLMRGAEMVTLAPNSELMVPQQPGGGRTILVQSKGSIMFDVEKRNVRHFEVETPFLAAVVKGTRFTVQVGASESRVSVERGAVEVFRFDSGEFGLLRAGEVAATVNRPGRGLKLEGSAATRQPEKRAPRPGILQLPAPAQEAGRPAGIEQPGRGPVAISNGGGGLRLTGAIGGGNLNIANVTGGLAVAGSRSAPGRAASSANAGGGAAGTTWSPGASGSTPAAGGPGLGVGASASAAGGGLGLGVQAGGGGGLGLGLQAGGGGAPGPNLGLQLGGGRGINIGLSGGLPPDLLRRLRR